MHFKDEVINPKFHPGLLVIDSNRKPWWFSMWAYTLSTLLLLGFPYRLLFFSRTKPVLWNFSQVVSIHERIEA